MDTAKPENVFGIGAITHNGRDETAVVVSGHVCPLSQIVQRHDSSRAPAPDIMAFLKEWDRWHDWLRGLNLQPDAADGWTPMDEQQFRPCVPEPWNIFQTYHNYDRPSRTRGTTDPPKHERVLPDMFMDRAPRWVLTAARSIASMAACSSISRSSPRSSSGGPAIA